MPGAAPCELPAFSQVSLDPGEIVIRGRGEEVLLQSSDASMEIFSGHGLSLGAAAVSSSDVAVKFSLGHTASGMLL
jgi:hypothetical protein